MPTFTYKARNQTGGSVAGSLVAETLQAATRLLDERSLLPIQIDEVKVANRSALTGRSRRISQAKVGMLYEQLADLLKAGVPVLRALAVLGKQGSSPALVHVLREVHDDVAGGDSLADAMEKHKLAFATLHVSMIRAGEKGGFLEDVLARLSEFIARQDSLKNKVLGAMIYPCVLLLGGLGAVTFLMMYVVPKLRPMLMQRSLPLPTTIVFAISDILGQHYLQFGAVVVIAVVLIGAFVRSAAGKRLIAVAQLKLPIVGPIFTMVALCRFCRIFGTLLANGIPILSALRTARESAGNPILAEAIDKAADAVAGGEALSKPLSESQLFPPAMIDMIAVSEESNTMEKVLVEMANTQEERTARQIDLAVRMIEPLMLLLLGLMVMFIAVALLLPILRLSAGGLKS